MPLYRESDSTCKRRRPLGQTANPYVRMAPEPHDFTMSSRPRLVLLFASLAALLVAVVFLVRRSTPPVTDQQLTVNALAGEPNTIDPNRASFSAETAVVRQVFEPLLRFDAKLNPEPAAATGYDVSADGLTYTFHLRPDGRFSDGAPVTAADFVYSFKRILDPQLAAPYATFLVDAGIAGADDYHAGRTPSADGVGVSAPDDLSFEVRLKAPSGYFTNIAALWIVSPLRPDLVPQNGDAWTQSPETYVGNGPFKLSEWVHQDHITLTPNPYYHGPPAKLQKLSYLMVSDQGADYAAYLDGERDVALVPDAESGSALDDPQHSSEVRSLNVLGTFWLEFNNTRPPFDNPLVRRAFSQAIDRQALIRDITNGVGTPATSIIPPGMPGYQGELGSDIGFTPDAARTSLAQAGYSDPGRFPRPKILIATNSANQRRAEFIQAQLKENLGVDVDIDSLEQKAAIVAVQSKDYDFDFRGWGADYPDPQDWFATNFSCAGGNNFTGYCNPEVDRLIAEADGSLDQAQRLNAYGNAQALILQDVPVAPLFFRGRVVVVKPYVQNLTLTPQDEFPGDFFFDQVSIAPH